MRHEQYMRKLQKDEEELMDTFYADKLTKSEVEAAVDPSHYNNHAIEPIEYNMANGLPFCEGNVVKYITRWRDKGGVADLYKCRKYIDFLIKQEEEGKPL